MTLNQIPEHKQRLGWFGPRIGMLCILAFTIVLLPLYFFSIGFNQVYFWVRRQRPIDPKPFFNFDRHKIAHLRFADKVWCEYCEWANGTLAWTLAIANEIERRYCPIQNNCDPHCDKVKTWRKNFLGYRHSVKDLENYYETRYLHEGQSRNNEGGRN